MGVFLSTALCDKIDHKEHITMKTRIIPKETNYQKWLNDYKIHCSSKDVIIGNTYKGYATIDGNIVRSRCKTIYYDAGRRILLAEDNDNGEYMFIHGRMYVYDDVIYFEGYNTLRRKKSLYDFVNEEIEAIQSDKTSIEKDALVKRLMSKFHPKIAGCFTRSFEIIADAYLGGWIK